MPRCRDTPVPSAWVAGFLLVCLPLFAGCGPELPARARHNVLLLSVDTLRADHLGAYGYTPPTSPNIDAFAAEGILFERTNAQAPSTLLSHTAILTSQIPQHHGASHIRNLPLAGSALTLAEVLAEAGYETASFNSGGQLDSIFGLDQGFSTYEEGPDAFAFSLGRTREWLAAREQRGEKRPFFLFLHTYEVHHPYTPSVADLELFAPDYAGSLPPEISVARLGSINGSRRRLDAEDLGFIIATYDAEIRAVDRGFGELLALLRQRNLLEDTVVVLTSDHGEEFGEHGWVGWHSHTLYEELLLVPLIFRLPGERFAGTRAAQRVRSIDIAPTLLDLLGIPPPASFDGRSLLPLFSPGGRLEDAPAIAFRDGPKGEVWQSFTLRRLKLNEDRLFDLEADPWERRDLAGVDPESRRRLEAELRRLVERRQRLEAAAAVELGEEERERLRALGYVVGDTSGEE